MATKLGKMVTYLDGLKSIKSLDTDLMVLQGHMMTNWNGHLHYQSIYSHQI